MTQVFQIYSRLEAPVSDVKEALENEIEFPEGIDDVEIEHVNGQFHIVSVPTSDDVGRYTPTSLIKGGLSEDRVVVTDDGTVTHKSVSQYQQGSGWNGMREEETLDTKVVEYVDFYGRDDEVVVHDLLRAEMFDILCQLASVCTSGHVQGIILEDGELTPVWYEAGGEKVDVDIALEHAEGSDEADDENAQGVQWGQHS